MSFFFKVWQFAQACVIFLCDFVSSFFGNDKTTKNAIEMKRLSGPEPGDRTGRVMEIRNRGKEKFAIVNWKTDDDDPCLIEVLQQLKQENLMREEIDLFT